MTNELVYNSGYYTASAAMGSPYRLFMERQAQGVSTAIQQGADQQAQAIREQTRADRENAVAIVASNAVIARVNQQGFEQQHKDALMLDSTLTRGFSDLSNQLGAMTASFSAGLNRVSDSIRQMSAEICARLDKIQNTLDNPLRTQARELYRRAADRYARGLFEEALKDVKAAVEKDETDALSWFLMGNVYLFGAGEFSNVIDLDQAIAALTNAAKYNSPDSMTKEARIKQIRITLEPLSAIGSFGSDMVILPDQFHQAMVDASGVDWREAGAIWEACGRDKEAIIRHLSECHVSDRFSAEIYFYLGLAKFYKSNELALGKADAEAESTRKSALQAFTRSLEYSDRMVESRYNSARCRTLLGDTEGALKDLETAIAADRNYSLKVLEDSDFYGISKGVLALINRIRKKAYLEAKPVFDAIKKKLEDTVFLSGEFPDKVRKAAERWVPETYGEDMPYFDIRDGRENFPTILGWLDGGDPGIQSKRKNAEKEAQRIAEAEAEARRKAEEERAVAERAAAEQVRYKKQYSIWLVLRIIFAIAIAGIGTHYLYTAISALISGEVYFSLGRGFLLVAIGGCFLGGIFGFPGGAVTGVVGGLVAGYAIVKLDGAGPVFAMIIGFIALAVVTGVAGLASGFIASLFYGLLKTILKAELKLEKKEENKS